MKKERFEELEVKPTESGWYYVTIYVFKKYDPDDVDYLKEWFEFKNGCWDYNKDWAGRCYVRFIHKKEK